MILPLLLVTACGGEPPDADVASEAFGIELDENEEAGVLALVNHPNTDFILLDDAVGLDRRAARNIITRRDGPDGEPGSNDDAPFASLDELDAVSYVGNKALERLLAYADTHGFVPRNEQDPALDVVNASTVTLELLDDTVGLDVRAARNIIAFRAGADGQIGTSDDRFFGSIEELDRVPYVGQAALRKLREYGTREPPAQACLLISEYIEGWGNYNKAAEIYNCGDSPVDLGGYSLCLIRNDDTTCTRAERFANIMLDAGAVFTTCRRAGGSFNDPMRPISDGCRQVMPGVMTFNGDDRLLIFEDADQDRELDRDERWMDALGIVERRPGGMPWQDVGLRRCQLTPLDGRSGYSQDDYFTKHTRGDASNYGVPPTGGCTSEPELGAGEACRVGDVCAAPMRCVGIPGDGSTDTGMCVDTTPVPGEGADCGQRQPCADGTLCAGTTLWGEGTCVAQWMAGRFINDQWYRIPDAPVPLTSSVVVTGLASVPVDITVTVQIDHSRGTDLRVKLIDPNGDEAILWEDSREVGRGVARSFVSSGISRDDAVNGRWTLQIDDQVPNNGGWLKGWDLFVVSRWD